MSTCSTGSSGKKKRSTITPKYIGVSEAAEMLSVDPSTLYRMIDAGILGAYRFTTRRLLIKLQELEDFMEQRRTKPRDSKSLFDLSLE